MISRTLGPRAHANATSVDSTHMCGQGLTGPVPDAISAVFVATDENDADYLAALRGNLTRVLPKRTAVFIEEQMHAFGFAGIEHAYV